MNEWIHAPIATKHINPRGQNWPNFPPPKKYIYLENEIETKNTSTWHLDTKNNSQIFAYASRSFLLLYSCRGPTLATISFLLLNSLVLFILFPPPFFHPPPPTPRI